MKRKHKYNAVNCEVDNIKFRSKSERNRYLTLLLEKKAGKVVFFLMQVPFHLPGGIIYKLDFLVFWDDGNITWEDVKGMRTPVYIIKKKQVEALYGITITEI